MGIALFGTSFFMIEINGSCRDPKVSLGKASDFAPRTNIARKK